MLSGAVELRNDLGSVQLGPAEQGVAEPGQAPVKRLLVNPRERVQWVAAYPGDLTRWTEFQPVQTAPPALAEVRAALQAGQWAQARALLLALSVQGDGGAVVELALADLEVLDGQPDAAQQRLALAWQRTQEPRTAAGRAELLMALDRLPEARTWLDTTRAASPGFAPLLQADADWHRLQGQGDAALALYRQALTHAEGDAQRAAALAGLGRALQERGDLRAARSALAQAVALAPDQAASGAKPPRRPSKPCALPRRAPPWMPPWRSRATTTWPWRLPDSWRCGKAMPRLPAPRCSRPW